MQHDIARSSPCEDLPDVAFFQATFSERARRLSALLDLDRMLSDAANRHSLAADLVHRFPPAERAD